MGRITITSTAISIILSLFASNSALAGEYDVGVLPAPGTACPSTTDTIKIRITSNSAFANQKSGWTGGVTIYNRPLFLGGGGYTMITACRIDGRQLKPFTSVLDDTYSYAVLSLGTSCPAGSTAVSRYIDTAVFSNILWPNRAWGSIAPNVVTRNGVRLWFCVFEPKYADTAGNMGMKWPMLFPNVIGYGVFANPFIPFTDNKGYVRHPGELYGESIGTIPEIVFPNSFNRVWTRFNIVQPHVYP